MSIPEVAAGPQQAAPPLPPREEVGEDEVMQHIVQAVFQNLRLSRLRSIVIPEIPLNKSCAPFHTAFLQRESVAPDTIVEEQDRTPFRAALLLAAPKEVRSSMFATISPEEQATVLTAIPEEMHETIFSTDHTPEERKIFLFERLATLPEPGHAKIHKAISAVGREAIRRAGRSCMHSVIRQATPTKIISAFHEAMVSTISKIDCELTGLIALSMTYQIKATATLNVKFYDREEEPPMYVYLEFTNAMSETPNLKLDTNKWDRQTTATNVATTILRTPLRDAQLTVLQTMMKANHNIKHARCLVEHWVHCAAEFFLEYSEPHRWYPFNIHMQFPVSHRHPSEARRAPRPTPAETL